MGACLSKVDESVNDFFDSQSRYYHEVQTAKRELAKGQQLNQTCSSEDDKKATVGSKKTSSSTISIRAGSTFDASSVLISDLSPIYPSVPKASKKILCRSVYDGDTLTLDDGTKVRLLGIDTPEIKEKQPFALEAKEYTKRYCHGRDIWLSFDDDSNANSDGEKNRKDRYGRLLAFVWVPMVNDADLGNAKDKRKRSRQRQEQAFSPSWLCINEGLVASGLAHAYFPSRTKKVHNYDKLLKLQRTSREQKLGQWKFYEDYTVVITPNGGAFHKSSSTLGSGAIKGEAESKCKHLARSKSLKTIKASEAYDRGIHPCRNCFAD